MREFNYFIGKNENILNKLADFGFGVIDKANRLEFSGIQNQNSGSLFFIPDENSSEYNQNEMEIIEMKKK